MGKMSDALRRAEEERRRRRSRGDTAPVGEGPTADTLSPPAAPPGDTDAVEVVPPTPPDEAAEQEVVVVETEPDRPEPSSAPIRRPARAPAPLSKEERPRRRGRATGSPDARLICFKNPDDAVAEQFRTLRTNLMALGCAGPDGTEHAPHTIVVTSTNKREGKTLLSANLAVAFADYVAGPVLAVDGDLRRPMLNDLLGVARAPGFSDVLNGTLPLCDAVQECCCPNLHVLSAGRSTANPTALLGSRQARASLAEMQQTYHTVVIDTPPVIALTDASILGSQSDGAVVVIRAGKTSRQAVGRCVDLLKAAGVEILGTVLNGVRHEIPTYIYKYV